MSKFKKGDLVVVIKGSIHNAHSLWAANINKVHIIYELLDGPGWKDRYGDWYQVSGVGNFADDVLEHERVYNSPLYLALL